MTTIDGTAIVNHTVRCFPALGGGYGVKVTIAGRKGGDFLLGPIVAKEQAQAIVARIQKDDVQLKSSELLGLELVTA